MKLINLTITNFRSITKTEDIALKDYTVLVGKNNEGKTNLLTALQISFELLKYYQKFNKLKYRKPITSIYDYDRDFPISLQGSKQKTTFKLEFSLTNDEVKKFKTNTGVKNNGFIQIEIIVDSSLEIIFHGKRGRGGASYNEHKDEITNFISDNFMFVYIPAIRTVRTSLNIISDIVEQELDNLVEDETIKKAYDIVREYERKKLADISSSLVEPIKVFIPNLISTEITFDEDYKLRRSYRGLKFLINDGNLTDIDFKGEGIKSLITLALINNSHSSNISKFIAIEEPESHLHPSAMHQISSVIQQISEKAQVIISTHNPVFVNRYNVTSNIIVDCGKVAQAQSISSIREILGTRLSDTLISSDIVVVVEGDEDERALKSILHKKSPLIRDSLDNGLLSFLNLKGATNLSYHCAMLKSMLCKYAVVIDDDESGRRALQDAKNKGFIDKNTILFQCNPNGESEFEDILTKEFYSDILLEYGYDISLTKNYNKSKNWSARLSRGFSARGLYWDDNIECEIKAKIVDKIETSSDLSFINPHYVPILDTIQIVIEKMLGDN
ncbi:MAG: AAA family ATPase [Acholeplasmataceae bacterium]|jgi:predicted ATPase|nr:AAA family ATPase [Acholeplasmataceae bacterium]